MPVLFGLAAGAAGAHQALPSDIAAERQALELRVLQVREAFGAPVLGDETRRDQPAKGKASAERVAQWGNWPNWVNWNNWHNWGKWFNG